MIETILILTYIILFYEFYKSYKLMNEVKATTGKDRNKKINIIFRSVFYTQLPLTIFILVLVFLERVL